MGGGGGGVSDVGCKWNEISTFKYRRTRTHYLRLYGIIQIMVKNHTDRERGNPLASHRLLFPISSKVGCGFFYIGVNVRMACIYPVIYYLLVSLSYIKNTFKLESLFSK